MELNKSDGTNEGNKEVKDREITRERKEDIEVKKNKKKVDVALLISIIALIISTVQLVISSPFFMDEYNKPKIIVEEGDNIMTGVPIVSSNFHIRNDSKKTATNLVLAADLYDLKTIQFYPDNAFKLSDSINGTYFFKKRYFFTKSNLIPNEVVSVSIFNYLDTIAKKVGADTLKPFFAYNCQDLVPHIAELKSDFGFAKIIRNEKYIIRAVDFKIIGHYTLEGTPVTNEK